MPSDTLHRPPDIDPDTLRNDIIAVLKQIYDPEIPINIYDLGLIYEIRASTYGQVYIKMTLTTPACPVAQSFPSVVENHVRMVPGVYDVVVELVWDPPWSKERMTRDGALQFEFL